MSTDKSEREAFNPDIHNETTFEVDAVIACLGDDAAAMRDENPDCEVAANMERAAQLLAAQPSQPATVVPVAGWRISVADLILHLHEWQAAPAGEPSTIAWNKLQADINALAEAVHPSAPAESGWQWVPVEPTDAMVKAGNKKTWPLPSQDVYRSMIKAAPSAAQPGGEGSAT